MTNAELEQLTIDRLAADVAASEYIRRAVVESGPWLWGHSAERFALWRDTLYGLLLPRWHDDADRMDLAALYRAEIDPFDAEIIVVRRCLAREQAGC